ncbi:paramyosin-related [Forsythia ovata]|uniref:Paramyosin-related n=1 Tax=Forsythia ovata TaxID=205694 RepID=A0ABD1W363_9LAMI
MAKDENDEGLQTVERSPTKNLEELNRRKASVLDDIQTIRESLDKDCSDSALGWRLVSLLESLKALERQETDFQSHCSLECSKLQGEVNDMEKILDNGKNGKEHSDSLGHSIQDSNERLESAKKELAAKLRAIVLLKRQLDEVPSQAELIQYELRFSELYTQIQKKLRQTRKHYDTYNALMEIKELMLKETSLLNSISMQFQDAITSADGRIKLINSLEGILKGIQQRLGKEQTTLQSEQKICDSLKEKYAAAISEQRHSYSLLKLFQEECARNERLRARLHEHTAQ